VLNTLIGGILKKLKELRTEAGFTQEKLSDMLSVSQQTIARWETGKAEPNIAALRDIAVIFGTSVDDLIEFGKTGTKPSTVNYFIFGNDEGFWGHLGLLVSGSSKTRWFPISLNTANSITRLINTEGTKWLVVDTLNNRLLAINLSEVNRLWLLDDADNQIEGDWELDWDGYQGYAGEIYKAIEDLIVDEGALVEVEEYSETLRNIVSEISEEKNLNSEKARALICNTHIHFKDGSTASFEVEPEDLYGVPLFLNEDNNSMIQMTRYGGRADSFFSPSTIRWIDIPKHKFLEGREC